MQSHETPIAPLNTQPYAHRAFMGIAGSFWADPAWSECLQLLMPACYDEAARIATSGTRALPRLMRHLEGNPVLAAYGLGRSKRSMAVEWDIWLDPAAPGDLQRARIAHGNHAAEALAREPNAKERAVALMQTGLDGVQSDVHLGLTPASWLKTFAEAAPLAKIPNNPEGLYLDVKSPWSSAEDIAAFVAALDKQGVPVQGVLSFDFHQLQAPQPHINYGYLVHGPTGLLAALQNKTLPEGSFAMFNGGTLIDVSPDGKQAVVNSTALQQAQIAHQQGNLRLAAYLQEDTISPAALDVLIKDCINKYPEVFSLGLAYGGISGIAEQGIGNGNGEGVQKSDIEAEKRSWLLASAKV